MEFRFSSAVDLSQYETQGLCDGIQPRLHNHRQRDDRAIIRAHEDWKALVGPIDAQWRGCLHPRHSLVSLWMPECLPERLEVVSYATEFGFLHDDTFENADKKTAEEALNSMIEGFDEQSIINTTNEADTNKPHSSQGKRLMQSKLVLQILSIDRERATTLIEMWTRFLELGGGGRGGQHHFNKLEDYIEYRLHDSGRLTWNGLIMFGCAITIPEYERQTASDLCRPAWIAISLTNDIFSWDREHADAVRNTGGDADAYVSNALHVIMREYAGKMDLEGSKEMCKTLIRDNVSEYLNIVERTKREIGTYSADLLRFLDALVYTIGGNVIWSLDCPRYHPDTQLSPEQAD